MSIRRNALIHRLETGADPGISFRVGTFCFLILKFFICHKYNSQITNDLFKVINNVSVIVLVCPLEWNISVLVYIYI
jgi:hypothetical protein